MIDLSFNVRISSRRDSFALLPLPDFTISSRPSTFPSDFILPITTYDLNIDDLSERVVEPIKNWRPVELNGNTIYADAIERVEIRVECDKPRIQSGLGAYLGRTVPFERSGTDVTAEFLRPPIPAGISVGAPRQPESIPIDDLFDRLITNEILHKATSKRFRDRQFADAVEAAFKCFANSVKEVSGHSERDGAVLMRHVFGAQSPLLKLNPLQSQSEKDEHNGYRDIFAGAMTGIRNPRAHEHETKDDPMVALELLTMANHLMRKLDRATKNDTQSEEPRP